MRAGPASENVIVTFTDSTLPFGEDRRDGWFVLLKFLFCWEPMCVPIGHALIENPAADGVLAENQQGDAHRIQDSCLQLIPWGREICRRLDDSLFVGSGFFYTFGNLELLESEDHPAAHVLGDDKHFMKRASSRLMALPESVRL